MRKLLFIIATSLVLLLTSFSATGKDRILLRKCIITDNQLIHLIDSITSAYTPPKGCKLSNIVEVAFDEEIIGHGFFTVLSIVLGTTKLDMSEKEFIWGWCRFGKYNIIFRAKYTNYIGSHFLKVTPVLVNADRFFQSEESLTGRNGSIKYRKGLYAVWDYIDTEQGLVFNRFYEYNGLVTNKSKK